MKRVARPPASARLEDLGRRLDRIESSLDRLVGLSEVPAKLDQLIAMLTTLDHEKEWYSIGEFAAAVGKAEFTVRRWCALRRIRGEKQTHRHGKHAAWTIPRDELLRYRNHGLRPLQLAADEPKA